MEMACSDFQPDFFNSVAAVAIVLIFAKVVAHRTQDKRGGPRSARHVIVVLTVTVATGIALWATAVCKDSSPWHWWAGGLLVVAVLVFVYEIIDDDVWHPSKRNGNGRSQNKTATS
jgi:protein-S-isoprenylcysteine O-methyltransferase Ste14